VTDLKPASLRIFRRSLRNRAIRTDRKFSKTAYCEVSRENDLCIFPDIARYFIRFHTPNGKKNTASSLEDEDAFR
jgi:hypothetical protein